ncbi:MAG: transporter substrate-binding protein, partial [Microvirga sp.]|nr:transporter substrate-binding protein [Microvirga sp.]
MPSLTRRLAFSLIAAATVALPALPASAQTQLKWAHVYETSEPYHNWALWAGEEL